MIEDRELESWREQWRSVAEPLPEIQRRVKRQNFRFVMSNLVAAIAFVVALILAVMAVRQEPSRLRIGWAVGIGILVFVCAGYRMWAQRGTWRPGTQSTRAFVELWHRRVMAKIRLIRAGLYLVPAWIVFCAALAAANWTAIGPDIHAHPTDWLQVLGAVFLMVLGAVLWLAWYRRRKLAELHEVKGILDEMKD
jgi:flagellar biogenesis protein FliO